MKRRLTISIPEELYDELMTAARENFRTLNAEINLRLTGPEPMGMSTLEKGPQRSAPDSASSVAVPGAGISSPRVAPSRAFRGDPKPIRTDFKKGK